MKKNKSCKIRVFALLRELIGVKEVELNFSGDLTVFDLLNLFVDKFGEKIYHHLFDEDGKVKESYLFLLNGKTVTLETKVKDGDVLAILPPIIGG